MCRSILMSIAAGVLVACGGGDGAGTHQDAGANQNNQHAALCGDGVAEGTEECDDGSANSDVAPDACRTDCRSPSCGDGVMDASELCDDGPGNSDEVPDACRPGCVLPGCGDGVVDVGQAERCDDGNLAAGDGCGPTCVPEYCGNGIRELGEVCDDGNFVSGDGCSADCGSDETCGNGRVDVPVDESCDCGRDATHLGPGCTAPNGDPQGECRADCQLVRCGNGLPDPGEACDDGNQRSLDGCSADCRSDETCGNGIVDVLLGEACDCGRDATTLGEDCVAPNGGLESHCRIDCQFVGCGNGLPDPGEVCDDGGNVSGDGCSADCRSDETCGNGITDPAAGEACDCGTDPQHLPPGCLGVNTAIGIGAGLCSLSCQELL